MAQEELVAVLKAELGQFKTGITEAGAVVQQMATKSSEALAGLDTSLKKIVGSLEASAAAAKKKAEEAKAAADAVTSLDRALAGAAAAATGLVAATGVGKLVAFAKDSVQAALAQQSLVASLRAVSSSAGAAQESLRFVRAESSRLGLSTQEATRSFTQLQAAARGTALEGEEIKRLFSTVSGVARVLGLSLSETNGIFLALTQTISKGTVQAEELRGQLSERLPGAFQITARALGVTTEALGKMLEQGQVLATEFIPALEKQLRVEFAGSFETASNSAIASFTRFANEVKELSIAAGTGIIAGIKPGLDFLSNALAGLRKEREDFAALLQQEVGGAPSPIPRGVGADFERAGDALRARILDAQRTAEETLRFRENATTDRARANAQQKLAGEQAQIQALLGAYAELQKKVELVQKSFEEAPGEIRAADTPFAKQTVALQKLVDQLKTDLTAVNIEFKLFGEGGDAGALDKAKAQLKEIAVVTGKISESFAKTPAALEAQVPGIQKNIALLQEQLRAGRAAVEQIEDREEAEKDAAREQEKAARAQAAREKRILEDRKELLDKLMQGATFQLRDPSLEGISKDLAYFNGLLTTETGPRLEGVRTILLKLDEAKQRALGLIPTEAMVAALDKLDQLAGKAVSVFEERRQKIRQDIAEVEKVTGQTLKTQETLAANLAKINLDEDKARSAALDKLDRLAGKAVSIFDERRERLRQDIADVEKVTGETLKTQQVLAENLARIDAEETKHNKEELKKQTKDYDEFAKDVRKTISEQIFYVLTGKLDSLSSVFDRIKQGFFRLLADMLAASIANPIVVNIAAQVATLLGVGGVGAAAALGSDGGGGGSVLGTANTALGAISKARSAYNYLSGFFAGGATAAQTAAGVNALGATGATAFYSTTPATAALATGTSTAATTATVGGSGLSGLAATSLGGGITIGTAASGAGLGVGTGLLASQLLGFAGLHGTGNAVLAGAAGGAVAGATIGSAFPVVGTIIGAVVGAIGGYLASILGKGPAPPGFTANTREGTVPSFGLDARGVVEQLSSFRPPVGGRQLRAEGLQAIQTAISDTTDAVIKPVVATLAQFPPAFQSQAVNQLNALSETLRDRFDKISFSGDNFAEQFQTFLEKDLPDRVNETFTPFLDVLNKLAPVFKTAQDLLSTLQQQEAGILQSIAASRAALTESGFTASQLFVRRRDQLQTLLGVFRQSDEAARIGLGKELVTLVNDLTSRGGSLFSQAGDPEGLQILRNELNAVLTEVETDTRAVFGGAERKVQEQIDLLASAFVTQQSMESLLRDVNSNLANITTLLTPIGSFQTVVGQVKTIPRTGLAFVHAGEVIGRPVSDGQITVNVDARGASNPELIGRTTATAVRQALRSMQQSARYRQDRGL